MNKKLLFLLVLLLTAATGAWATDYTTLAVGDVIKVGDTFSPTADVAFNDMGVRSGTYTLMRADVDNDGNVTEKTDGAYYVFKFDSFGEDAYMHFGKAFAVTAISDGLEVTKIENIKGMLMYTLAVHEPAAASGYTVSLKDGTQDAGKWTVKAGTDGSFQSLPLEGVKAGTKVKLKYDGDRSMVKGVTAVKKAAIDPAKAYLTWDADQKKLVATEIPATYNTVANASTDVSWSAGTYVVDGQVTITGTITLSGDVNLIIKDGAKLTANKIMGDDKNLSIYGQAQKTGELVVSNSADAIRGMSTLEVHSAKVTATASTNSCGGIYSISTFNVYGGEVDAKATGYGYGISLNANGSMNIYGGEVKAEGKGNSVSYSYGIRCGNSSTATVTVYGGKLLAWNANNKAFYHINLTIDKSLGFNGEIETSSDNSTWNPTVGTPDAKYVRVGF